MATSKLQQIGFYIIILLFGLIYCSISLVNHYLFRTAALDLGVVNSALYSFAHGKANMFTLSYVGIEVNYFGDHFSPITILYAPFYYLFGSYTLLLIQIAAILFGGVGIYKIAKQNFEDTWLPHFFMFHFFCIWGIYSALSFDFHNNVIAAMLVPWFVLYWRNNRVIFIALFFILILISKENMPLWLACIMIGLLVEERKNKSHLVFKVSLVLIALIYFVVVNNVIMPHLLNGPNYQLSRFGVWGSSLSQIAFNIISHPIDFFRSLFVNNSGDTLYDGVKSEFHFMVLVSGGLFLLIRPQYLLMLAPIYMQKFLTEDGGMWGISLQYSIEFVPIISLALISFTKSLSLKTNYILVLLVIVSTSYFMLLKTEARKAVWYDKTNTAFYSSVHYNTPYHINEINKVLNTIPDNAIVCASSSIAAHLALRERVYLFPFVKDAEYVVVLKGSSVYPLSAEKFELKLNELRQLNTFNTHFESPNLLVLKRK